MIRTPSAADRRSDAVGALPRACWLLTSPRKGRALLGSLAERRAQRPSYLLHGRRAVVNRRIGIEAVDLAGIALRVYLHPGFAESLCVRFAFVAQWVIFGRDHERRCHPREIGFPQR